MKVCRGAQQQPNTSDGISGDVRSGTGCWGGNGERIPEEEAGQCRLCTPEEVGRRERCAWEVAVHSDSVAVPTAGPSGDRGKSFVPVSRVF